jgi:hypothetical protein
MFLNFMSGDLLPNFNKMSKRGFLTMALQQIEDTLSIAYIDLRSLQETQMRNDTR